MRDSTKNWLTAAVFSIAFVLGACGDSPEAEPGTTAGVVPDSTLVAAAPAPTSSGGPLTTPASTDTGAAAAPAAAAPPAGSRTIQDRVYTVQQANRGQELFETVCVECHTPDYFRGEKMVEWKNKRVGEIYEFASTMMPANAPGTLAPQDYIDVIAYMLRQNGFPTGSQELPADQTALNKIYIVLPPGH